METNENNIDIEKEVISDITNEFSFIKNINTVGHVLNTSDNDSDEVKTYSTEISQCPYTTDSANYYVGNPVMIYGVSGGYHTFDSSTIKSSSKEAENIGLISENVHEIYTHQPLSAAYITSEHDDLEFSKNSVGCNFTFRLAQDTELENENSSTDQNGLLHEASDATDSEVALTLASLGNLKHDALVSSMHHGSTSKLSELTLSYNTSHIDKLNSSLNHFMCDDSLLKKGMSTVCLDTGISYCDKVCTDKDKSTLEYSQFCSSASNSEDIAQLESENLMVTVQDQSNFNALGVPAAGCFLIDTEPLKLMIGSMHKCASSNREIFVNEIASEIEGAASQLQIYCTGCQSSSICWTSSSDMSSNTWNINSKIENAAKKFNFDKEKIKLFLEELGIKYKALNTLQKNSSKSSSTKTKEIECEVCKKKFKWANHLKKHMHIHNRDEHICPYCHAYFNKTFNLKEHIKKHENYKFECTQCSKLYTDRSSLLLHVKTHHEKKYNIKCKLCGKMFYKNTHYKEHCRIHTKEKPYCCDICGKTFAWHDSIKKHKIAHEAEAKFRCGQCGKQFRWRQGVYQHLMQHHNVSKSALKEYIIDIDSEQSQNINCGIAISSSESSILNPQLVSVATTLVNPVPVEKSTSQKLPVSNASKVFNLYSVSGMTKNAKEASLQESQKFLDVSFSDIVKDVMSCNTEQNG